MKSEFPRGATATEAITDGGGRRCAAEYVATLTLPNCIESVRPAAAFLVQTAKALHVAAADAPLFDVAVTEALTNSVKHGRGAERRGEIRCELVLSATELTLRIFDEGPGFAVPPRRFPPVRPDQVEALRESGYGLPIIQSVFSVVRSVRVNDRFGLELTVPLP